MSAAVSAAEAEADKRLAARVKEVEFDHRALLAESESKQQTTMQQQLFGAPTPRSTRLFVNKTSLSTRLRCRKDFFQQDLVLKPLSSSLLVEKSRFEAAKRLSVVGVAEARMTELHSLQKSLQSEKDTLFTLEERMEQMVSDRVATMNENIPITQHQAILREKLSESEARAVALRQELCAPTNEMPCEESGLHSC